MSRSLRKKPVRSLLLAPPSTVARAFLTSKFWPTSASPSKTSSAWAARRSTRTKRIAKHGQERYLERPGQGATPRHRSAHRTPYPPRVGPLTGHRRRRRQAPPRHRASRVPPPRGDYHVRFHDQGDTIRITAVKRRREAY